MATIQTFPLADESRYKDTNVLSNLASGKKRFELWERPPEIDQMEQNATRMTVTQKDIGRLDLVAWKYYDNVKLWWIIAAVNNIVNPIDDMYEGQVLLIPDRSDVTALISRPGKIVDENA